MGKLIPALLAGAVLAMAGCSSSDDKAKVPDVPPTELYQTAYDALQSGNFATAAETLEALDARYPYGPHSAQVQLDLIYAYYKSNDPAQALANIDRFIRLNPSHPDMDYVLYMRGLTNMSSDYNMFQSMLNIDRSDRDPTYARQAFADFNRLLNRYPDSYYSADAAQRMVALKNRLANYELAIVDYYMRRQAYVAAANRAQKLIAEFPDTAASKEALQQLVSAYDELGLPEAKRNAQLVLDGNS